MEKWNSQLEQEQPMEKTRGLFCMRDSGVAHCQTKDQYHLWRMCSMFERIAMASKLGSCQSYLWSS